MTLSLDEKFLKSFVSEDDMQNILPETEDAINRLRTKTGLGANMLGWLTHPETYDKVEFDKIIRTAENIKKNCEVFVVIGIGGSYLGSRAVIEFVHSPAYNEKKKDTPNIYFAGYNISATDLEQLVEICKERDFCINVISKSGTTTEPAIAFRVLRALLDEKYGHEEAKKRIFVTTDAKKGTLKGLSEREGYETFVVPDDIGGRFSVLSAVGLLPIAVSGIDIDELMRGARDAMVELSEPDVMKNDAYRYAAIRNILYRKGKKLEILVGYEYYLTMWCEWWKQLFGESEGKDGRGLYPASVIFSTDLHSLGQYIQDGERTMFETVLDIVDNGTSLTVPNDPENIDGLNFLSGKKFADIDRTAMMGTLLAHVDGGVPNVVLHLKDRSVHSLGYMIYFFELSVAVSGYILGINPFDQPGVEAYKKNMFALLGKPGYEEITEKLRNRL